MLLPIIEDRRAAESDAIIKTISSRIAGGRRELNKAPSQVYLIHFHHGYIALMHTGDCGHAGIPLNTTVFVARIGLVSHTRNINGWRLYHNA